MAMTLGELLGAVVNTIGGDYISDATRYFNKGLLELSADSQVLTRKDVAVTTGGIVAIPTDCLIVKDIYYNGYRLGKYGETDIPEDASGDPYYWIKNGSNVELYPAPDSANTAQVIYIKNDAALVDELDAPTLEHADEFLIAYAKYKVLVDVKGLTEEAMYWKGETERERQLWLKLNSAQEKRTRRVRIGRWT